MRQLRIDLEKCKNGRQTCGHECESACAQKVFKLDDPAKAALHINAADDGSAAPVLCNQCGDCVVVCPAEALKRNKQGVVMIDTSLCVGCFMCVGFCEKAIFERHPGMLTPYKCKACGICVKACPAGALEIVEVPEPPVKIL